VPHTPSEDALETTLAAVGVREKRNLCAPLTRSRLLSGRRPGDRIVAGDWNANGTFTPALFRPSDTTMYFRYTNTQGTADDKYIPAPTDMAWLPVSGKLK